MTTPDPATPRPRRAPIVSHVPPREPVDLEWLESQPIMFDGDDTALMIGSNPGESRTPGQLWQRLAELDVERHGRPVTVGRPLEHVSRLAARTYIADNIERRRPAMRAARAELEAVNGFRRRYMLSHTFEPAPVPMTARRLEPEPSAMARTGLAVGLAFTSDDATA